MKVVELRGFGAPDVLVVAERAVPDIAPHEVLVRVEAAGVNFSDVLIRGNRYAMTPALPVVLGSEVAGTIEAVGDGVRDLQPGDRVAAALFATTTPFGGYAEKIAIAADWVAPLPDGVSAEQAAAVMVTGLTARLLLDRTPVAGSTVLITAAAGGVGSMLVQLARADGAAQILAAAGGQAKLALAQTLGADFAVDYRREGWVEAIRTRLGDAGPDAIFESTGGDVTRAALEMLGDNGRLVLYGALNLHDFELGAAALGRMLFRNQSLTGFVLTPLLTPPGFRERLAAIFAAVQDGAIEVPVSGRFALRDAAHAHELLESRKSMGKLVLVP